MAHDFKGYKFWYSGMRDLRARLALMAVALTMVGKIFMSTMAPSKSGPKNGTYGSKDTVERHETKTTLLLLLLLLLLLFLLLYMNSYLRHL